MKIIAITNQKGGVGKTTTAVTLAHGLALLGLSTLLIDLDAQGNCADSLGIKKFDGLYNFLVLKNLDNAIIQARKNLDLIPGNKTTVEAKKIIAAKSFSETVLHNALEPIINYDIIVLDTAPSSDILQINALVAATHFLIPVNLAFLATVGARDLLGTVASLQKVGAFQGKWLGILPTLWERTSKEKHGQLIEMTTRFGQYVWPPIPEDVKAIEAPRHGKTLWEYAPKSRAITGIKMNKKKDITTGGYHSMLTRAIKELGLSK